LSPEQTEPSSTDRLVRPGRRTAAPRRAKSSCSPAVGRSRRCIWRSCA